ncbi:MAG TPA: hypothetical protein VJ011_00400, partial [Steroidobacteraceae bacterium]|nr:hypothetical protein [Steroidobacteraceae bacterium]
MASPAPSATRATDATGVESQTPTTASPARLASEVIAVTTSDEFLLELGEALGGQASVRPVDSVANALEHLGTSRRAQLIAFDMRGVTDVRADVERARAKAPHVALLAFAEASAEQATAASLKGSDVFAILPIPVDRAKTAAIFEGALAAAAEKRAAARGAAAQKPAGAGRAEAPITVTTASPPEASPAADGERKLPMVALV